MLCACDESFWRSSRIRAASLYTSPSDIPWWFGEQEACGYKVFMLENRTSRLLTQNSALAVMALHMETMCDRKEKACGFTEVLLTRKLQDVHAELLEARNALHAKGVYERYEEEVLLPHPYRTLTCLWSHLWDQDQSWRSDVQEIFESEDKDKIIKEIIDFHKVLSAEIHSKPSEGSLLLFADGLDDIQLKFLVHM